MGVNKVVAVQSQRGCNFNSQQASWHCHSLSEKILQIDFELIPLLPMMRHVGTSYKKPFVLSGKFAKWPGAYCGGVGLKRSEVGGPFTAVWYTPFDPGKIAKVKEVMLDYGWIPDEWNNKKMPIDTWSIRKRLQRRTYKAFMSMLSKEESDHYETLLNTYFEKHFNGRSRSYMEAMVFAMGFSRKDVPTVHEIKKKLLLSQYWLTSPKIDPDKDTWLYEDSSIGSLLSTRMMYSHRRSLLQGLLKVVRPDGKIPGEANPCGTPTARFTHKKIVNIPSGGSFFGKECRSLFISDYNGKTSPFVLDTGRVDKKTNKAIKVLIPKGRDIFVGFDAAGLELRILTHYLIKVCTELLREATEAQNKNLMLRYREALDSAYTYRETLLEGDIHSHNQALAGLPTRDAAKSMIYAHNYGAGDAKLGTLVGGGASEGKELRARFMKECLCISVLIEWAKQHAFDYGWLPGLDGRKLIMRKDEYGVPQTHKALNTLLQAGGSIVVKKATLILDEKKTALALKAHQVIHMHDEAQFTSERECVPTLRSIMEGCVKEAGEHFNMECPLASDSMMGSNWSHTH